MFNKILFLVSIILLLAICGCISGPKENAVGNESNIAVADINDTSPRNQNAEWISVVMIAAPYLYEDMKKAERSSKALDIPALKESANSLYIHADAALTLSQKYEVSPKLLPAKKNFETSIEAYRSAATYMSNGADKAFTNTEKATSEFETARQYINTGTAYMSLATAEIAKFTPWRQVTLDAGYGEYTIPQGTECNYLTDSLGNQLNVKNACYTGTLDTSQSGIILQKIKVDLFDSKSESSEGTIKIDIRTLKNESMTPEDAANAMVDAVDEVKKNAKEKQTYEATLADGQKVIVHSLISPASGFYNSKADVFSFMLDDDTIILVVSSTSSEKTRQMIRTLQIGPIPTIE